MIDPVELAERVSRYRPVSFLTTAFRLARVYVERGVLFACIRYVN